jgi:hypothetical protein
MTSIWDELEANFTVRCSWGRAFGLIMLILYDEIIYVVEFKTTVV